MDDIVIEFLMLFIAGCIGFIAGLTFMAAAAWRYYRGCSRIIERLETENEGLRKELGDATGICSEDEHTVVGRSPPIDPVGNVPGAGRS